MLTTKRLLLGLLVLGVVGMHGLVTSSGTTAAHHGWSAAASAALTATTTTSHEHAATSATPATPATSTTPTEDGDESTAALALCMTLLLAVGAATFGGRRTTWVAEMRAPVRTHLLPFPPVLRDSTPVPRFTVMRC